MRSTKDYLGAKAPRHLTSGCLLLESRQPGTPQGVLSLCLLPLAPFVDPLSTSTCHSLPPSHPEPRPRTPAIDVNDPPAADLLPRLSRASATLKKKCIYILGGSLKIFYFMLGYLYYKYILYNIIYYIIII